MLRDEYEHCPEGCLPVSFLALEPGKSVF
uniref:Uncharacterized protein n=1 Tax=Anguilla anguilla TaxID=7936 RepID=A0A0E9RGC4_ANGAN